MRARNFVPFIAAGVGWVFPQVAFTGSVAECRMIYGALGALWGFVVTGVWVWMGHLPVRGTTIDLFPAQHYPQPYVYHGPYVDPVWAEGQRERARLMWLDGTPTPPTDWFGAR